NRGPPSPPRFYCLDRFALLRVLRLRADAVRLRFVVDDARRARAAQRSTPRDVPRGLEDHDGVAAEDAGALAKLVQDLAVVVARVDALLLELEEEDLVVGGRRAAAREHVHVF